MKLKKILIGIIFVLSAFIIMCLSLVLKNRYDLRIAKNSDNQEIVNVEDQENLEENTMLAEEIIENEPQEEQEQTIIEEQQEITSTDNISKEVVQPKTSSNSQSKTTSSSTPQTTKQETKSQAQTQTQVKQETTVTTTTTTQEPQKTTEEKKESSVPVVIVTEEPKEIGEKYIRNDAMINKIKSVIENNPSEYMTTYGYTIVVDSSIKENTNQFTFTETRVKSYIGYKFGTIRIYAEDYYKNGQLIMTECYIL